MSTNNYKPQTILITGGCGFIGSNFIHFLLSFEKSLRIINIDSLTYAGNLDNLIIHNDNDRYTFIKEKIQNESSILRIFDEYHPDTVINFAAESHVDRSIANPQEFLDTNVGGTLTLLRSALKSGVKRYVQISTDEVYGSLGATGLFTEKTPISPNSPYAASKASADHFVQAFNKTHNLDTIITRCSNNYGPYQFPEKLIPLMINNAKQNLELPVYGQGLNIRDWIYVKDHCRGIWAALTKGRAGQVYNFGGNCEMTNIEVVKRILKIMSNSASQIKYVEDRKGHDFRYAIDHSKASSELNWNPMVNFEKGIEETVKWYMSNTDWLESVTSGDYLSYYERQYGERYNGSH